MGPGLFNESRRRDCDVSHDILPGLSLFPLASSLDWMYWPGTSLSTCAYLSISKGARKRSTESQGGSELPFLPQPQTCRCPL